MLTRLGQARAGESLTELLLACHARIRRYAAMAETLALPATAARPPAEIADGADGVRRYFEVALPLHVADEELSLTPRLLRHAPTTAAALATMRREHGEHAPLVAAVIACCREVALDPRALPRLAPALAVDARALAAAMDDHLAAEERELFGAIPDIPAAEQAAIVAELRARRAPP